MGRRKDHKANRKNAPGRARNRARAKQAEAAEASATDALDKECPKCGAAAGDKCVTPSGGEAKSTHAARLK